MCDAEEISRGLCMRHYQAERRSIRRGEVKSWDELVTLGLALPPRPGQGADPDVFRPKLIAAKRKAARKN